MSEGEREGEWRIKIEMKDLIDRKLKCGGEWEEEKCKKSGENSKEENEEKEDNEGKDEKDKGKLYKKEKGED